MLKVEALAKTPQQHRYSVKWGTRPSHAGSERKPVLWLLTSPMRVLKGWMLENEGRFL